MKTAREEIARRSRGTPRIANRLLRRVRDYAQVRADGRVTQAVAQTALDLLEVDQYGLDEIDQKIMLTILEKYGGGPVGVNTIAASIAEEPEHDRRSLRALLDPVGLSSTARRAAAWPRIAHSITSRSRAGCDPTSRRCGSSVKLVYLSLGSNIGDREHMLQSALDQLRAPDLTVKRRLFRL